MEDLANRIDNITVKINNFYQKKKEMDKYIDKHKYKKYLNLKYQFDNNLKKDDLINQINISFKKFANIFKKDLTNQDLLSYQDNINRIIQDRKLIELTIYELQSIIEFSNSLDNKFSIKS